MVGGRIWTLLDIFPDDGEPVVKRDANGKKIIPPVAYYVFGTATFVTVGLTIMMIPVLKESIRMNRPMQNFIAHRNAGRRYQRGERPLSGAIHPGPIGEIPTIAQALARQKMGQVGRLETTSRVGAEASNMDMIAADIEPHRMDEAGPSSRPIGTGSGSMTGDTRVVSTVETAALGSTLSDAKGKAKAPDHPEWPEDLSDPSDPALTKARWFNTLEERRLFGSSPAEGEEGKEQIKPSIYREARHDALKALGIATGIVLGSAGIGVWIVSKILGVSTVEEFAGVMRGTMSSVVPSLVQRVDLERQEASENNADVLIDRWLGTIRETLREKPGEENLSLRGEERVKTGPS